MKVYVLQTMYDADDDWPREVVGVFSTHEAAAARRRVELAEDKAEDDANKAECERLAAEVEGELVGTDPPTRDYEIEAYELDAPKS